MAYLPMAVYGLEVPPGDMAISARSDIPAAFRITMAAIDPSAEPEGEEGAPVRATLKILRLPLADDASDSEDEAEDEDFDPEEMDAILAGAADDGDEQEDDDDDDDDEEEDTEVNGGPSDPTKTKKARKAAAEAAIRKLIEAEGMDLDGSGINGITEDDDDEEGSEDEDDDAAEIEQFVICTLDPQKSYQQTLDIAIGEDEQVWFSVTGTHSIFLTGNYIEPAGNPYDEEDEEDSDDGLEYDLEPDSDELDDEELDALDELADPISRITEVEEDEEEEEAPALVKPKKGKNKRAAEEVDTSENLDDMIAKDIAASDVKLSKKQKKKQKKNDGSAAAVNGKADETPASAKSDKKVAFAKNIEQGPTPSKADAASANGTSTVKTVQGVKIDVRTPGTGPAAKKGDRIQMRYIGKLENGKMFDSNKKGKPFTFKLGAGDVIKGWDVGVLGRSVGSEFRLTIPPHLAYGSKGAPPDIPSNSTLIFDLKLLQINK